MNAPTTCSLLGHAWVVKGRMGTLVEVCSVCGATPPPLPGEKVEPIQVKCPDCGAQPGNRCTTPTSTRRRPVEWFHAARKDAADGL